MKMAPGRRTESLNQFFREGISSCRVNHPNAVTVLDSGISETGIAYLAMELLVGRSLTQELKLFGRCSLLRCAQILVPVCQALAKAHVSGFIHRDIKPDNIFLPEKMRESPVLNREAVGRG
ncbi:MAG: protein kinase [Acidobacteria bacterium]|nr:protein kinase [Acidobacteriota bacterium]